MTIVVYHVIMQGCWDSVINMTSQYGLYCIGAVAGLTAIEVRKLLNNESKSIVFVNMTFSLFSHKNESLVCFG